MVDIYVCPHDEMPCNSRLKLRSGRGVCIVGDPKNESEVCYVCSKIRFKGKNSVRDIGFGMTIREKLERQGLFPK